jgi:hypothetical protein
MDEDHMASQDDYYRLLGKAALDIWGDMPREIQEALFETAVRDSEDIRSDLARLLHERHPRTEQPQKA